MRRLRKQPEWLNRLLSPESKGQQVSQGAKQGDSANGQTIPVDPSAVGDLAHLPDLKKPDGQREEPGNHGKARQTHGASNKQ